MPCTDGAALGKPCCCAALMQSVEREPSPSLPAAQGEPVQDWKDMAGRSSWLLQLPPPPPWCPGPGRASQIHRGAANPLQSWDSIPKIISPTLGPCVAGEPHARSTLWKVSMDPASSGQGRWATKVWTWVASSAQQPS